MLCYDSLFYRASRSTRPLACTLTRIFFFCLFCYAFSSAHIPGIRIPNGGLEECMKDELNNLVNACWNDKIHGVPKERHKRKRNRSKTRSRLSTQCTFLEGNRIWYYFQVLPYREISLALRYSRRPSRSRAKHLQLAKPAAQTGLLADSQVQN